MLKLVWRTDNIILDSRCFKDALSAQRFVRKQLTALPQVNAKWQPQRVTLFNGPQIHSTFTLEK